MKPLKKKATKIERRNSLSSQEWQIIHRQNYSFISRHWTTSALLVAEETLQLACVCSYLSRFRDISFCILVYIFEDSFLLIIFNCKCHNCHAVLTVDFQPTYTSKILIPYSCCTVYIYIYILH